MKKFEKLGKKLSKAEQRKIKGGVAPNPGTRCVAYCCDSSNNCGVGTQLPGVESCSTHEECQQIAIDSGATCPSGYYVAGLCKG